MEPNTYLKTRKEERTEYFATLTNRAHSAFINVVQVLTFGDMRYIDYLRAHPEDLKLTFAYIVKDCGPGSFCRIVVCNNEEELDRAMYSGEDWLVTELWEEKREINITEQMIAKAS